MRYILIVLTLVACKSTTHDSFELSDERTTQLDSYSITFDKHTPLFPKFEMKEFPINKPVDEQKQQCNATADAGFSGRNVYYFVDIAAHNKCQVFYTPMREFRKTLIGFILERLNKKTFKVDDPYKSADSSCKVFREDEKLQYSCTLQYRYQGRGQYQGKIWQGDARIYINEEPDSVKRFFDESDRLVYFILADGKYTDLLEGNFDQKKEGRAALLLSTDQSTEYNRLKSQVQLGFSFDSSKIMQYNHADTWIKLY